MTFLNTIRAYSAEYRGILTNGSFNLVKLLIAVVFIPILTHVLDTEQMGKMGLFLSLIAILRLLIGANLQTYIWKKNHDHTGISGYKVIALKIMLAMLIFFLILGLAFHEYLLSNFGWLYPLIIFTGFLEAFLIQRYTDLFSRGKYFRGNVINLSKILLDFILTLGFILLFFKGHESRIIGYFIACLFIGGKELYHYLKLASKRSWVTEKRLWKDTSSFILPLFPSIFFSWIILHSDRFIIESMMSDGAVGIYTVAYSIGIAILHIDSALSIVWTNLFYKWSTDYESNRQKIKKGILYYSGFMLLAALLIYALTPLAYRLFIAPVYWEGAQLVVFILLAYVFNSANKNFMLFEWKKERTTGLMINSGIAAGVNVLLNVFLIPHIGLLGAAISTSCTYFLLMVLNGMLIRNYSFRASG